ncbi:FtsX-like permease family protein [Panacibacter ginsenosidivorans]|uniref:FtsX-like permease family protein n=1 Tax=Panacibacter ginsenosidivorans TaxID=1813871 RepID=A0A5B8V5S4_9BACT|nr:ABC transporter permease [Panacibacter ginsenosidivorans]QEC65966.1 FtsX-like permease family protein [Panacibacter ginsenosidivorans]
MFRNYFKTAWRNIRKNKLFSAINILGLSIGMALCFIIMLYVQDELSYDRFNENADNIARVVFQADINGGKINESVSMPPVAQTMKKDFPEVQDATRLLSLGSSKILYKDKEFKDDKFALADPNFFSIFTLPMVEGDPKSALLQANTVVITQSTAKKYFGEETAIGKTIALTAFNNQPYTVTGVIKDVPANSHFQFNMFGSMTGWAEAKSDSWLFGGYHTYLLLKPHTDLVKMETRLPDMVAKYMGPQIQQQMGLSLAQFREKGNSLGFTLQPLTDIHLNSNTTTEFEPGGNEMYVYIFAGVAIFMLLVACINFINLSTAGASKRAKEVGIRKVAGSGRFQLIKQFLSESILITFFALLIAFAIVELTLPAFNNISGKQLTFDVKPILAFAGLGLIVGIIAGIYPAFYLSSFIPIAVLKGKLTTTHKSLGLRSSLVVFQFFISVALIIGTIVVYQQMKFIQNKDLGFNKEQIITIPNSYVLGNNEKVFKQQMLQDPRIVNATTSWYKPAGPTNYNNALAYPQGNDNLVVNGVDFHVDEQYIPTMGMTMVSGRNFSKEFPTDSFGIILNETAAKAFGWNNTTALNKTIIRQNSDRGHNIPYKVIGVVKNFNFKSLHEAVSPLYMTLYPEGGLIFKTKTTDVAGLLATMKKQWESYNTGEPFSYSFMDDLFNKTYSTEQKTGTILNIFSILTIFVACLGLFGLATYTAEQRTKEIGIRKVLGASVTQVTQMLSKEFLKLVLIASLIAFPAAWWAMNKWLQSFAYRINISWWVFAVAGIAALLIALLTVSFQAIKAALSNPVKSLRTE